MSGKEQMAFNTSWKKLITYGVVVPSVIGILVTSKCCHDHPATAHSSCEKKENTADDAGMVGAHGGHPPGQEMSEETRDY